MSFKQRDFLVAFKRYSVCSSLLVLITCYSLLTIYLTYHFSLFNNRLNDVKSKVIKIFDSQTLANRREVLDSKKNNNVGNFLSWKYRPKNMSMQVANDHRTTEVSFTKTQVVAMTKANEDIELSSKPKEIQKCSIPKLDPFHPDVIPFFVKGTQKKCQIKRAANLVRGHLIGILKRVSEVGYHYIRRAGDFNIKLSKLHSLKVNDGNITGKHS